MLALLENYICEFYYLLVQDRDKYLKRIGELEHNHHEHGIQIITGLANPRLARSVANILEHSIDEPISKFSDGERRAIIKADLRRRGVFIIQPTSPPEVNGRIAELKAMLDAARRESPGEITAVVPYFAYARQDRREQPGAPIMAAVIAREIVQAGADRIVTIDLHSEQIMGAVNEPWDNLYASHVLVPAILKHGIDPKNTVVESPDKGGVPRTIKYAELLGVKNIAMVYKQRDIELGNQSKALFMMGDVEGKDVIIPDDQVSSGGTLFDAVTRSKENGAKRIFAAMTHGLFLDNADGVNALEKLDRYPIDRIFITDSIKHRKAVRNHPKIEIVSVDELLADAIFHIHTGEHLFEEFAKN